MARAEAKEKVAREARRGGGAKKADMAADDLDWAGGRADMPAEPVWAPVRVFPLPAAPSPDAPRTDFRETIFWAPAVKTGEDGRASVRFPLSDAVTSFRVVAEGAGRSAIGRAEKVIKSSLPFSLSVKLPTEVSAGDRLLIPLTLTNDQTAKLEVSVSQTFDQFLTLGPGAPAGKIALDPEQRASLFYPAKVSGRRGTTKLQFAAAAGVLSDEIQRELSVVPVGFPQTISRSGTLQGKLSESFELGAPLERTITASIKLYPSPVSTMISGLEGMLREPSGCFEQTSSSNYPNVMIMQYMKSHDVADPALVERVSGMLERGYKRLTSYETKQKGYEWFGSTPPHEALSAYGVLEFVDMKRIFPAVDDAMIARTVAWLKGRRDGSGGYKRDPKALDSFGGAAPEVTNAYITYSLVSSGLASDLGAEIGAAARLAESTEDAYLLALATGTLLGAKHAGASKAVAKLASMQGQDGAWTKANHSITRSTGGNLHVETTSLALLDLMAAGGHDDAVRRGIEWLTKNRSGYGTWGATQATVLGLRAMTEYAIRSRKTASSGTITLMVNGKEAGKTEFEAGRSDPVVIEGFGDQLARGNNTIELVSTGKDSLPYAMAIEYRSLKPANGPEVQVDLTTVIERTSLKMGDTVRLTATVTNKTQNGLPMTLARIGLPSGLTYQPQLLKELREKGLIGFFETRAREVILYFRDMKPGETKVIPLDLVATIPGEYTGPASSAYLYYTDDQKIWADGIAVTIAP